MRIRLLICGLAFMGAAASAQAGVKLHPYTFKADSGAKVQAQWGEFTVPKHYAHPGAGTLKLAFVRFPSTNPHPGAPIVYLAGGPGGSGIEAARGPRFKLFMALRKVADVIALDQRGTGSSDKSPACVATHAFPASKPLVRKTLIAYMQAYARHCHAWWQRKGIDAAAYNTWDSAEDLNTLRRDLHVKKISLLSISYGATLALTVMKRMPRHIDRVVLASPVGPSQMLRLPARTDQFLKHVAGVLAAQPKASKRLPPLLPTMRRVLTHLKRHPATVTFTPRGKTKPVTITFGAYPIQLLTVHMIKNPSELRRLPVVYALLAAGRARILAPYIYKFFCAKPMRIGTMGLATEAASGMSAARYREYRKQAGTAILGGALNFPMPFVIKALKLPDLGAKFRKPTRSTIPSLVLTGLLDGRTYPAGHDAILRHLKNGEQITIDNAGHDLFMSSPKVTQAIVKFMRGQNVNGLKIHVPPPAFVH